MGKIPEHATDKKSWTFSIFLFPGALSIQPGSFTAIYSLMGKFLQWGGGKFDFGHHFAILTIFSKKSKDFSLTVSFSAHREDFQQQKFVQNGPSVQIL